MFRILDYLGVLVYISFYKCLVELVSNCYDVDVENVWIMFLEEFVEGFEIIIYDDGNGMILEIIKEKYLYVGYNRRSEGG